MKKSGKIFYFTLSFIGLILAIGSILSLLINTESRYLKLLDFPRIQFFIAALIGQILFFFSVKGWQRKDIFISLLFAITLAINGYYLISYTFLVPSTVPSASEQYVSEDNTISMLISNVKMSSRNAQPLLDLINERNPDIVLAMEIDSWWGEQLTEVENKYEYSKEVINDLAYGMGLYSKHQLEDIQINYFSHPDVPSFESTLNMGNGKKVLLYTMHPVPPTHFDTLPDNEGEKEVAMVRLGNKIKDAVLPIIVAGDFNDVTWGATNRLTETDDLLRDVRVGRGFYNTFNADNIFMSWALDHVFVTEEFKLKTIERLPDIGSDHYPLYVELVY